MQSTWLSLNRAIFEDYFQYDEVAAYLCQTTVALGGSSDPVLRPAEVLLGKLHKLVEWFGLRQEDIQQTKFDGTAKLIVAALDAGPHSTSKTSTPWKLFYLYISSVDGHLVVAKLLIQCQCGARKDLFRSHAHNRTRRSARPHVLVLIFCFFFNMSRPPYSLALDNKTPFKLRHNMKMNYVCQLWSFLSLPRSFIFPSFYSSRLPLLDNAYRHRIRGYAVAVRSLICLVLAFPLYT